MPFQLSSHLLQPALPYSDTVLGWSALLSSCVGKSSRNPPRFKQSGFSEMFDEDRVPLGFWFFILGPLLVFEREWQLCTFTLRICACFFLPEVEAATASTFLSRTSQSEDGTKVEFVPQLPSGKITKTSTISKCNRHDCAVSVFRWSTEVWSFFCLFFVFLARVNFWLREQFLNFSLKVVFLRVTCGQCVILSAKGVFKLTWLLELMLKWKGPNAFRPCSPFVCIVCICHCRFYWKLHSK